MADQDPRSPQDPQDSQDPQPAAIGPPGELTRMVLLGLLVERGEMHGYEIKATLAERRYDWWAGIQSGSLYGGLKTLVREGLVEEVATTRQGNRPPRRRLRATAAGRAELRRLLEAAWASTTRFARPVDVALCLYLLLPRDEIVRLLERRLEGLARSAGVFEAKIRTPPEPGMDAGIHAMVRALFDHESTLIDAEIRWTRRLLDRLSTGELDPGSPWRPLPAAPEAPR